MIEKENQVNLQNVNGYKIENILEDWRIIIEICLKWNFGWLEENTKWIENLSSEAESF